MAEFHKLLTRLQGYFSRLVRAFMVRWISWRKRVNRYTAMQMVFYRSGTSNHPEHNENPDYWNILLGMVRENNFDGRNALDFACGKGRNITNLLTLANWRFVDGVDISPGNIQHCKTSFDLKKSRFWVTNGTDLGDAPKNFYDLIVSTIALQHIPVYDIRKAIFQAILQALKPGGCLSFQMGYGPDLLDVYGRPRSAYFENALSAEGTNADHDVRVTNTKDLVDDLLAIGYANISHEIRASFSDAGHPQWIYVRCFKPQ